MSQQPLELNIPVLTDVIRSAANLPSPELESLLAEVQTKLASRTFKLADDLLRSAFADAVTLERRDREASVRPWVERYARRLEHHCRAAPYNWFNFYDYWA